jgi:hypothetical protein
MNRGSHRAPTAAMTFVTPRKDRVAVVSETADIVPRMPPKKLLGRLKGGDVQMYPSPTAAPSRRHSASNWSACVGAITSSGSERREPG